MSRNSQAQLAVEVLKRIRSLLGNQLENPFVDGRNGDSCARTCCYIDLQFTLGKHRLGYLQRNGKAMGASVDRDRYGPEGTSRQVGAQIVY